MSCASETASRIDAIVVETIKAVHKKALDLLKVNESKLHKIAGYLLEKETITGDEFMKLLKA